WRVWGLGSRPRVRPGGRAGCELGRALLKFCGRGIWGRVTPIDDDSAASDASLLPRHLCRVMGFNKNHSSRTGTLYHLQVEDLGPIFDEATEAWVRRLNVIAYANYGEPTARIVYGKDHDLPHARTHEPNRVVAQRIHDLAAEVALVLEEKEERQVGRVKNLLERYYRTRDDDAKREFEEANRLYPLVFARAFQELKASRAPTAEAPPGPPSAAGGCTRRRGGLSARRAPARARARDRARGQRAPARPIGAQGARRRRRHPAGHLRQAPGAREGEPDAQRQPQRVRRSLPGHDAQQPGDRLSPGAGAAHSRGGV